ncbi:MAG: NADH-quinone oxidoreductase subunit L [Anaerolineales bacterium]|nr:NADH-quinone oxidoreductase subunit L [Anaerolineales bacterium]
MILSEVTSGGGLFTYAPLLIALPVMGLLINIVFGRRFGERFSASVASGAVALAFVVAILQFLALRTHPAGATVHLADWITIGELSVPWSIKVDTLSATMMLMVTGVSTLIHIYAAGYMHEDVRFQGDPGRYTRFFIFFNLFVAAMMVLVTADNYLMMFVGWEGVGLCSYLLIGFWYEKGEDGIGNAVAGKKAFVTNRIGDFGFLIAMFLIFGAAGSLQFDEVFHWVESHGLANIGVVSAITLFLLLGATGKSAQLPLFVWLPDAMAGPTPVSALIHAATMVTAGIYMIARSGPLFDVAHSSANLVALIGAATAFFAATIAVGQFDIKRVLAYSTISQLGFMMAAVGIGAYVAGMFHLVTHAFFKALLFLSSGSVIQGVEHGHHHLEHSDAHHDEPFDPQDMRNMGGLRSRMKITYWVYLIGALALAGLPPLAGFFSKDEILADASMENTVVYVLLAVAAFFTAFYMGRQILMVFFGKARSAAAEHAVENPPVMTIPLITLAGLSIIGGALNLPGVHALTDWLEHSVHIHVTEFNIQVAAISVGLALVAIAISWVLYGRKPIEQGEPDPLRGILGPVFVGMENKWWVDELYELVFIRPYIWLAHFFAEVIDWRFWHDWFHDSVLASGFRNGTRWLAMVFDLRVIDGIANGLGMVTQGAAVRLRGLQTGYVRNYALAVLVGSLLVLTYFIFG